MEGGAEFECEREELLDDDAVLPDQRREAGPVEELEDEVRALVVENGVEGANDGGVAEC
jgi:hypothetical protein